MERVWTQDLPAHAGQHVRLAGWLHHQRQLSRVTFLVETVVGEPDLAPAHDGWLGEWAWPCSSTGEPSR